MTMSRRRLALLGLAFLAACAAICVGVVLARRPRLRERYLAPQFRCSCGHKMILEFRNGRTRLHNVGHSLYYEAGTYSVVDDRIVWDFEPLALKLILTPTARGLYAADDSGVRRHYFSKEGVLSGIFSRHDLSGSTPSKSPLKKYLGGVRNFWNAGGP